MIRGGIAQPEGRSAPADQLHRLGAAQPAVRAGAGGQVLRVLRRPREAGRQDDHPGGRVRVDGGALSARSEMTRMDVACSLAMIGREMFEDLRVFTFSNSLVEVPGRRGFALRDAITGFAAARRDGARQGGRLAARARPADRHHRRAEPRPGAADEGLPDQRRQQQERRRLRPVAAHRRLERQGARLHRQVRGDRPERGLRFRAICDALNDERGTGGQTKLARPPRMERPHCQEKRGREVANYEGRRTGSGQFRSH